MAGLDSIPLVYENVAKSSLFRDHGRSCSTWPCASAGECAVEAPGQRSYDAKHATDDLPGGDIISIDILG
jgi:hypothetical protein